MPQASATLPYPDRFHAAVAFVDAGTPGTLPPYCCEKGGWPLRQGTDYDKCLSRWRADDGDAAGALGSQQAGHRRPLQDSKAMGLEREFHWTSCDVLSQTCCTNQSTAHVLVARHSVVN